MNATNACDILFERCGSPKNVEKYIRNLGFKDIRIQKTEKQMHANPAHSRKNWCTPQSMVELLGWFAARHTLFHESESGAREDDQRAIIWCWRIFELKKSTSYQKNRVSFVEVKLLTLFAPLCGRKG